MLFCFKKEKIMSKNNIFCVLYKNFEHNSKNI